jgi:hypothetical protein
MIRCASTPWLKFATSANGGEHAGLRMHRLDLGLFAGGKHRLLSPFTARSWRRGASIGNRLDALEPIGCSGDAIQAFAL